MIIDDEFIADLLAGLTFDDEFEIREIPGWFGYAAGRNGSVWSRRKFHGGFSASYHRLKPQTNRYGYSVVHLRRDGKGYWVTVHTLVLTAFVGPRPVGYHCCHGNDIRTDNRLENLRWDTMIANIADMVRRKRHARGEQHPRAKLNEQVVLGIIDRMANGEDRRRLACEFGITPDNVSAIAKGKSWKHLPRPKRQLTFGT